MAVSVWLDIFCCEVERVFFGFLVKVGSVLLFFVLLVMKFF